MQVEQSAVIERSFDVDVGSDTLSEIFQKRIKDDLFVITGFCTIPQKFIELRDIFFLLAGRAQNSEIFFNGHLVLWLLALKYFGNFHTFLADFFLIFNLFFFNLFLLRFIFFENSFRIIWIL